MQKDRIAIVGVGCRFPGGVNDTESFWKLLIEGRDAVADVPPDRWNVERYYDPEPGIAGKTFTKRAGFLDQIDQFDPQFFGISPREAPYVDPQHRLLLETAWEAIENAGLVLDLEKGNDIAVFVGVSHNDYQGIQSTPSDHFGVTPHTATGSAHSIAANRISYCFNLRGPSVAMDTACSSALTAVHTACEHIWSGRGNIALAGGVTVMITPGGFIGFSQASMLSPDGRCAAFDAKANGFVRGEGAGIVLLKRFSQAVADGDSIQGVILGSSINQDGHTNGISLPSAEAQSRLVQDACRDAGVSTIEIGFVEAHGTGTAVGDPIEAHALAEALCKDRLTPLPIGSVKTNLGHLETAAGVAGLLKAMLVVQHGRIPASLHFNTPNPHIDFEKLKLRVPTAVETFPETGTERLAGVNSFGFGGANAHVILAEPPLPPHIDHGDVWPERAWPIVLSARSEDALRGCVMRLAEWLTERLNLNGDSPLLPDLTYTLGARRNHQPHRLTLVARSIAELIQELDAFAIKQDSVKSRTSFTPRPERAPRIAFVMSGQGPQWWGMGRELMQHEPVFRRAIEACAAAIRDIVPFSLLEELSRSEDDSQMHRTAIAQPAIFAMQIGLAELWKSWGVHPAAIVGHSVSEIAAACVAGLFSLEQGARITALRARFMDQCARGEGKMLAVGLGEEEAQALIDKHDRTVSIAAFNGPRSLTLAGPRRAIEAMFAELETQDVFARLVRVDHPFHHPMMQPASEALENALADLTPHPETIPLFSTVTGERLAGQAGGAAHWGRGVREPVRFAPAINAIADFGVDVWLELGAHPALARSIQECLASRDAKPVAISSVRREREHESLVEAAMDLHRAGVTLDFKAMTPSRRLLSLPAYAWDRSRWWNEAPAWRDGRLAAGGRGLLDIRLPSATPTWTARLDGRHMAYLKDHKVEDHIIFPAAGFVDLVLEAGVQLFEGRPFVVEDLEIRKPLILPDPVTGVYIEVSYEPNDRTFAIQSRFEQGASWSLHVVGSMRGERTESTFACSSFGIEAEHTHNDLKPVDVDAFYRYMNDLGLRYGEAFRSVRELFVAQGESKGLVELSDAVATRASEYPLHPVLLDGALHVFSAGRATVEARGSQLKLPVRFARILFLRSPGPSARVQASVLQCNDEFVEGRIGIYDKSDKPCVLVDGFRAISITGVRRGFGGAKRDVLYHLDWERTPAESILETLEPLPLQRLQEVAHRALDNVIALRGRTRLEGAIAAQDDLAAALLCSGLREMGARVGEKFTADSLKIATSMRPVFEQLMLKLKKRGLLDGDASGYRPTSAFVTLANCATNAQRSFIEKNPAHLPEALLVAGNCAELGPILRGEKEAVQVLFAGAGAELLDQFYGDGLLTSHWLAAITAAVREAARVLPEGRGLRILEAGGGTGGLSAQVLPALERGLHSYTFTDVSAAFFPGVIQKLAAYPEVQTKIFDLEKPAGEQNFEPGSFDFIIGTNVLHAVADIRFALRNLHHLLAPGGSLVFMDVATPQLWTETVFGLTSGWWRFADYDLRTVHPLLGRSKWETVLREAGFVEISSLPGLMGPYGEGQIALLARKTWHAADSPKHAPEASAEKSWLVFADESALGSELIERLSATGVRCRIARRGSAFTTPEADVYTLRAEAREDWEKLFSACAGDAEPERIVYLWNLDTPFGEDAVFGTDALLHFVQALETVRPTAKVRIDSVTRGAQSLGREAKPGNVVQSPAIGLMRVILNEYPNYVCRGIDLPPTPTKDDIQLLWSELLRADLEREVALRGKARYVQRLDRGRPRIERSLDPAVPLRLESRERGQLSTLRFAPFEQPFCHRDEVLVDVKAAGMNFRDVLKALALYPGEAPDARIFGDEVGGVVVAVGSGVTHLRPGDRVFGLAVFGLATQTIARGSDVRRIPDHLSFEEAATLPVVFMTSWHALRTVARLRKGETVLIHAGAGGVGMAAIQIAHHLGAEVIASAGNPAKRALLEVLGVKHVIDSRRGDFVEAVMGLTNRRGVDVVLNALAGEAIPMGLACLAEFGRFVEIGKRDIYQNSRIPLRPLRANASFHVVAMDAVFAGDKALTQEMLAEIADLVDRRALHPLPFRAFPANNVDAAFRLMASGKHIGKVIVSFPEEFVVRRGEPLAPKFEIKPDGCYLVTGAFGGFGRVIANWLVQSGARNLVLYSRSGASTAEAEAFVEGLRDREIKVQIVKGDTGSRQDVSRLFTKIRESGRPLRGVFHLAMVIDDAPLSALSRERLASVIGPKALGAWLLHEATREMELDCFVMFSSVSSIFGNPAQGNYAAANAFLDSLAHHRRASGLPALTINWGVLGGEGYVARNERVAEFLAKQGISALSPGEVTSILDSSLRDRSAQVAAIRVDWTKWRTFFRGMQSNPLLDRIFAAVEGEETKGSASDWRQRIEAASADEKETVIAQAVREVVGSVLRVKPDTLRDDQPLTDLGLDSLMGVEIENSLEAAIGVALPPTSLMRARTIGQIAILIAGHIRGGAPTTISPIAAPAPARTPASTEESLASAVEVDLDALSGEEIERLIGDSEDPLLEATSHV